MGWFSDMREYYRVMGLVRFTVFFGGLTTLLLAFAGVGIWLMEITGWPEVYGSNCHGRGCWPSYLTHSPKLLEDSGIYELLLFAWLWSVPFITASTIGIVALRRWLTRRRDRIKPLDF